MNLNRLIAERQNVADRIEEIRADVAIDDDASGLLTALLESGGARELHVATRGQRADIEGMLATTDRYLAAVEDDVAAGLTHRADLERQELARHQMKASLLQNTRDQLSVREQVTRLELELLRVRVDRRIKELQLRSSQEALTRMNELLAQMQERPIFRAVEKSQNVAFVSYKEVDGVAPGAVVYRCKVWGYLDCSEVGKVADVLPGEVTAVDPWGTSARGQYATLDLSDASAARARSLRVRHGNSSFLARARTQAQTPRG
jgi:hypothetical protein